MSKVYSQNNNFVLSSHSFVHFFTVTDDCDVKMHHFTFFGGHEQVTTNFSFSYKPECGPQKLNFREICHFSLEIFKLSEMQLKSAWLRLTQQLALLFLRSDK